MGDRNRAWIQRQWERHGDSPLEKNGPVFRFRDRYQMSLFDNDILLPKFYANAIIQNFA